MHLPASPPPPRFADRKSSVHLAALWSRVARTQTIPDDVDVDKLYVAIRDRLRDHEWEVRLHALRALADLLPVSRNALAFPFDEVVDNLGHGSPTVRKAALDALKVFCLHCEDPDCALRAVVGRCDCEPRSRPTPGVVEGNIITGLVLSIPSIMAILRRRRDPLDVYPVLLSLGFKLFDVGHRDVALRSMVKLRRVCGTSDFVSAFERLNPQIQDKFRVLCEVYDDDNFDVQYGPRRSHPRDYTSGARYSADSDSTSSSGTLTYMELEPSKEVSSDDSRDETDNVSGKVIIETEITFDSDTAITMTVLEDNDTEPESDRNYASDESYSSDRNMLKGFSETDSEDPDLVVSTQKRVRFGGETVKIRTPDSDNLVASEEENKVGRRASVANFNTIPEVPAAENASTSQQKKQRKSGIPLPVISKSENSLRNLDGESKRTPRMVKKKSKSLSELYDYFRMKNNVEPLKPPSVSISTNQINKPRDYTLKMAELMKVNVTSKIPRGFALSVTSETMHPEKAPSPVEPHREVEVLHNLQRSPTRSPQRSRARVLLDQDGFVLSVLRSSPERSPDVLALEPTASPSGLKAQYEWETVEAVPRHIVEQLHNTENWISAVRAADQLHRSLLEPETVRRLEPVGVSLAEHMWALGDAVGAARAPAESAVCALLRSASAPAARRMLPTLVRRLVRTPPPAALPHALLARLTLPQLVDLIFDTEMIGVDGEAAEGAQLQGTWCVARAAGPAAVLAAVRHRLTGQPRAEYFCEQLRKRLRRPAEGSKPPEARSSMLPVPVSRRRARSTPPPAPREIPPRRLRPIADSAPLAGSAHPGRDVISQPLFPILTGDSSAVSSQEDEDKQKLDSRKFSDAAQEDALTEALSEDERVEDKPSSAPRSPSIRVEDFSDRVTNGDYRKEPVEYITREEVVEIADNTSGSQVSLPSERASAGSSPATRASTPRRSPAPSRASSSLPVSKAPTRSPSPTDSPGKSIQKLTEASPRDVRAALAASVAPPRQQEDWEAIIRGLREVERLAADENARAPAASWRAVARATASHVRSLRSRVARTACYTLGSLFETRGRVLEPETEEAAGALLDRTADVNRFLRGDAEEALVRLACGVTATRAATALMRRGATHRAGPVRAAAAGALAELVARKGPARVLDLPSEPRTLLLRAAVELLGDASPDARAHARRLCIALAEDARFWPLLKESLPATKYRSVEKSVDRLRCR